jgi:thiamine biosynthesis lipoprotein
VLADFFESKKVNRFIIELGGEIRVKGKSEQEEAWTIGVENPGAVDFPGQAFEKLISMETGAITTSGSYRKYYESGNKHYSHIIDPRTGYPAQTNLVSVSVMAPNATIADAYDNVLMVLGLNESFLFLKKHENMEAFFIYRKDDGTMADTATAGFYKYFKR